MILLLVPINMGLRRLTWFHDPVGLEKFDLSALMGNLSRKLKMVNEILAKS